MSEGRSFRYELLGSVDDVRAAVASCEGKHVQQCAYSTFMGTLTQVCFTEYVIRGTIRWEGARSWNVGRSATPERAEGRSEGDGSRPRA